MASPSPTGATVLGSLSPTGAVAAHLQDVISSIDAALAAGSLTTSSCRIHPPLIPSFIDKTITPDPFYAPDVFVWVPQLLRPTLTIACPSCRSPAADLDWTWRRIVDVDGSAFVVARLYSCCSMTFATCDPVVLRELPSDIQAAFPAITSSSIGITRRLVGFVKASDRAGLSIDQIHAVVGEMHRGRYLDLKGSFESSVAQAMQSSGDDDDDDDGDSMELTQGRFFSSFDDPEGYGGFVPPASFLAPFLAAADNADSLKPRAMTTAVVVVEKKRKRRRRRCQNQLMVNGEMITCGLEDCPGRGGQKFCKNLGGKGGGDGAPKLLQLATLLQPVKESERVAMEALQNMI